MTDMDPFALSYNTDQVNAVSVEPLAQPPRSLAEVKDELDTILGLRGQFPPRMPLAAQLEVAWLDGDDETARNIYACQQRINEITGRPTII